MSIFVTLEDENNESFSDVLEINRIQRHFPHIENSLCVRFINDGDDTVFNRTQNDFLLKELLSLKSKELRADEQEELAGLLKMSNKVKEKKNLFIKFYGEKTYTE